MKRNDTRQKQQVHHKKILSSRHPGHRDLKAMEKNRTLRDMPTCIASRVTQSRGGLGCPTEVVEPLTSAICMKICWGYWGRSTSYKSFRYATCMYTFNQDTMVRGLKCHLRAYGKTENKPLVEKRKRHFYSLWSSIVLVAQLCLTLCVPTDCIPPGSSVHGILQPRILE